MLNQLIKLDKELFYFINVTLSNPVTDLLMPIITNGRYWLPFYIFMFIYFIFIYNPNKIKFDRYIFEFWKNNKTGLLIALLLALGVILTDGISAKLIKEWLSRIRPCRELNDINLLVNCGAGKSFPSTHASNNFGAALILSRYKSKYKFIFFTIAFLVSISRVFVGVHYPFDIFFGAILGLSISYLLITLFEKFSVDLKNLSAHR